MGLSAYFSIIRPLNASVAGIAGVIGFLIAQGTLSGQPLLPLVVVVVACITAAGNTINDYFDRDIDRVNRPDRPLPAGKISPHAALYFSILLFLAGNVVAGVIALSTTPLCLLIAAGNSLILLLYASRLKGMPLVGNIAVSYLAASVFLFGGALTGVGGMIQTLPVVLITFCAMLARELIKDAEDVAGDREGGATTLPMIIGVRKTVRYACFAAATGVVLSYLPVVRWWGIPYLAAITAVDAVIIAGVFAAVRCTRPDCVRESRASTLIKVGMFAALVVFIAAAVVY
ncbi:MAG: digeranylgeranylglyceryl phosphate synthase [Methanoculleus sp. SDB]|nr:MAG: digeranylgeranylglyceryl phosphate synthase [Methanoculleus sp. SDB]